MFSRPLLGTDIDKVKLSWIDYIWNSCIRQGWYDCWYAFKGWADLMGNNYDGYGLAGQDDLEACILYFWDSLEDDIYPKEFLESLMQMADDVKEGRVETYPMDEVMERVKNSLEWADEVLDGVDLNEELNEDDD